MKKKNMPRNEIRDEMDFYIDTHRWPPNKRMVARFFGRYFPHASYEDFNGVWREVIEDMN